MKDKKELREELSREREEEMKRPWERAELNVFVEQKEGLQGWSRRGKDNSTR